MSRNKINGNFIKNIKRMDNKTIYINLKNGDTLELKAIMVDYDDCELLIKKINNNEDYYDE